MKKIMVGMVVFCLILCSSSSFACNLCVELEKRGFSPEVMDKAVSWYFGASVKVSGSGKSFQSNDGAIFNIAISKTGKVFPVTAAKKLRGVVFDGTINTRPAKIFIVDGIDFVGIKIDRIIPIQPVAQPVQAELSRENVPGPGQIIETSMADAPALLLPVDQALQDQKEAVAKTDQLVKRAEYKKKEKNQKLADAGVTTAAIVAGVAIPVYGPFVASGIIITRVVYGLFQDDDPDES